MIITIDGPAASGKSTVAKALAKRLNFYYLYTGMLYRAVAYILLKKEHQSLNDLNNLEFIKDITYEYVDNEPRVFYKQEDVTTYLADKALSEGASIVSANNNVRTALLNIQRDVAKKYAIVADGRDCGSVVFPDAEHKFFLTASLNARARRAFNDKKRNNDVTFEELKKNLEKRDKRDTERDVSPLIIPNDAIVIDNSDLNQEETLNEFLKHINH